MSKKEKFALYLTPEKKARLERRYQEDGSRSMLAAIGRFIAPIFKPLGFGEWIPATALLTGLSAKEAVVSTLAVLTNVSDVSLLPAVLAQTFTPLAAASFLTFTLLYMPCFAAVAAVKRELGGAKYAVAAMAARLRTTL